MKPLLPLAEESDMKKLLASVVILAGVGTWFFGGKLFASMPVMTMTDTHVLVGNAPGDHALYAMNARCEIHAASVGYQFNSWNMGFLTKLGARGILSFMNADSYKANEQASARTGRCMASCLNDCLRNGEIQHLILVPRDAAALAEMRQSSLAMGKGFHLKGRYLAFQEGTIGGKSFQGNMEGTGYFLVESIGD
jgi:hypothetical protein